MRKPKRQSRLKNADTKYLGDEPTVLVTNSDIHYAYNWYNYFHDVKTGRKWLEEYCKANGLSLRNTKEITMTMCTTARLLNNGHTLPEKTVNTLHNKIKTKVKSKATPNIVKAAKAFPLYKFEELLDKFYQADYKYFDPKSYDLLKSLSASSAQAKTVFEYYAPLLAELDEEVGYEHLKKVQRNHYKKFVKEFLDQIELYSSNKKTAKVRKPRKRKEISAAKMVSRVKYLREDPELKMVSIQPEKIIGANVLWLYNTKYKKLVKLESEKGFTVNGTTVKDFDTAVSKTIRKPEEFFSTFYQSTKAFKNKAFKNLKTKESGANGRINEQTLILRIY